MRSCRTRRVACPPDGDPLACGRRALRAADWETALLSFRRAGDSCAALYGHYLARLFRLYANFNRQFYRDVGGTPFAHTHLTRDLSLPLRPDAYWYHDHYRCLVDDDASAPDVGGTTLLDRLLAEIWDRDCRLDDGAGGPISVPWTVGRCEQPAADVVLAGIFDRVDAVLLYLAPFGSPAQHRHFWHITAAPASGACGGSAACEGLEIDGIPVPRLAAHNEWVLARLLPAVEEYFSRPRTEAVFQWIDSDGDGHPSLLDEARIRACDSDGGRPLFDLDGVTLGASWRWRRAELPAVPGRRVVQVFRNPDGSLPEVLPGEEFVDQPPPPHLVLFGRGNLSAQPSPDGSRLLFARRLANGEVHLFVTRNELDDLGEPVCADEATGCCVTCEALPGGIRQGEANQSEHGVFPQWIADPADPGGAPLGIFFTHNEHPSAWGWPGVAQATSFLAIRPDGSQLSSLLPPTRPPFAIDYHAWVSPDGRYLYWNSTWNPDTNTVGPHRLLLAEIAYDAERGRFRLRQAHPLLPAADHGWYEADPFPHDFPDTRTLTFTNGSFSMQEFETFAATLGEDLLLHDIVRLTDPDQAPAGPFRPDRRPGWREFSHLVDHGRQVVYTRSAPFVGSDRIPWLLAVPPVFDGVLLGFTVMEMRFGFEPAGYLWRDPVSSPFQHVVANVDGTRVERLWSEAMAAGWIPSPYVGAPRVLGGRAWAVQRNAVGEVRYVALAFEEPGA